MSAILPELEKQLAERQARVVLLLTDEVVSIRRSERVEVRTFPHFGNSRFLRVIFDQILLPILLLRQPRSVLFASGSFSPILKARRAIALLRNAIYFDPTFLGRETKFKRFLLRLQGAIVAMAGRGCSEVHYPSHSMKELVETQYASLRGKGVVNYYGIGRDFLRAIAQARNGRDSNDPYLFLYVMNYTLQKNLSYLLQALSIARREKLRVRVMVTTQLSKGPKACYEEDRKLIYESDLINSGYLSLIGPKFGQELADLYRTVDACIFPSFCEAFGHPLVEAMAVGKPVVCSDLPYAREICGDHAIYMDTDDPEDLVRIWRQWPSVAANVPLATKEELQERFSWEKHVSRLLDSLLAQV